MKKILATIPMYMLPGIALAQAGANDANSLFGIILNILNGVTVVIIAIAVVVFIWGIIKYILSAGDESAQKEARGYIIYGIIGIFVMVSVWGLVNLLEGTFNFTDTGVSGPQLPNL